MDEGSTKLVQVLLAFGVLSGKQPGATPLRQKAGVRCPAALWRRVLGLRGAPCSVSVESVADAPGAVRDQCIELRPQQVEEHLDQRGADMAAVSLPTSEVTLEQRDNAKPDTAALSAAAAGHRRSVLEAEERAHTTLDAVVTARAKYLALPPASEPPACAEQMARAAQCYEYCNARRRDEIEHGREPGLMSSPLRCGREVNLLVQCTERVAAGHVAVEPAA